jgi:hypothetical protein
MPTGVYQRRSLADRFMDKVDAADAGLFGCWLWTGAQTPNGYGVISVEGHLVHAHRVSHQLFKGQIPEGFDVDHLCRTRLCVRPEHLEAVTRRENLVRAIPFRTRRTACLRGHERTPESTYTSRDGNRHCMTCQRMRRAVRGCHGSAASIAS